MRYDTAPARRRWILDHLRETGFVSVTTLTRALGVSDMTVRRDLRKLQERGEVRVVHGGVSLRQGPLHHPAFLSRTGQHEEAKTAIAAAAFAEIRAGMPLAVDAGTTTYAVARALPDSFRDTVVTHSIPVIQLLLSRGRVRVLGLGGDLVHESQAFAGPMTVAQIRHLRIGTFFLGAAAVDEDGLYVAAHQERATKLALIDAAERVVLLADHSKFDRRGAILLCPLDPIDVVVTDAPASPTMTRILRAAGVHTLLAPDRSSG